MRNLSLEQIKIAEPCTQSWNAMAGDDRKRFCNTCNKHVHDLSGFTRVEAERLIGDTQHVCIRMRADDRGQVITADDLPLPKVRNILRNTRMYWIYGLAVFVLSFLTGLGRAEPVAGAVAAAPTPPNPPSKLATMGKPAPPPTTQCTRMGAVAYPEPTMGEVTAPPTTQPTPPPPPGTAPAQ